MDKKRGIESSVSLNKKISTKELKVFFLIFNLIIATIAFSYLVRAPTEDTNAKAQASMGLIGQAASLYRTFCS